MRPSIAGRVAIILVMAVRVASTKSAVGQTASTASAPVLGSAQASPPSTSAPGPRVRAEWRSVEPTFADSSATAYGSPTPRGGSHTITVSTLVLVLAVVILVLLVTR